MIAEYKRRFADSWAGKYIPAIVTALFTALFTSMTAAGSVWLAMHDDILMLKTSVSQINKDHDAFKIDLIKRDDRLNEVEKEVSKMEGRFHK